MKYDIKWFETYMDLDMLRRLLMNEEAMENLCHAIVRNNCMLTTGICKLYSIRYATANLNGFFMGTNIVNLAVCTLFAAICPDTTEFFLIPENMTRIFLM